MTSHRPLWRIVMFEILGKKSNQWYILYLLSLRALFEYDIKLELLQKILLPDSFRPFQLCKDLTSQQWRQWKKTDFLYDAVLNAFILVFNVRPVILHLEPLASKIVEWNTILFLQELPNSCIWYVLSCFLVAVNKPKTFSHFICQLLVVFKKSCVLKYFAMWNQR